MGQLGAVSAGQRYIKTYHLTRDRTEWEVVEVKNVGTALPHALLVNCRDPFDMRTVSCAELTHGGVFDLAEGTRDAPPRARSLPLQPTSHLVDGGARMGRLLRQITLAIHRFKRSWHRAPMGAKTASAAARRHPHLD